MFTVTYVLAELRRRLGRTLLTALGLGLGVALVVTVSSLSTGLDRAQEEVLQPLTGVGTDLSVSRPIDFSQGRGGGGFPQLSDEERQRLREEGGPRRLGLRDLGEPGTRFSRDTFASAAQLSFPASEVGVISGLAGVSAAAGGLTLNAIHVEGTVPERTEGGGGFGRGGGGFGGGPPENIDLTSISVAGVDDAHPELGAVTEGQVTQGSYFGSGAREAIVNESYASANGIALGDGLTLGGKTFTVVGVAETPLGGQGSDVYVQLSELQALSGRKARVNAVYVRADSAGDVASVSSAIEDRVDGASVTTAQDLADRVSGSVVDAQSLVSKLGTTLMVVGLLAAFLIASLLTLSSVTKRTRELGTLKAIGWTQGRVVGQVTAESLVQGLLGAAIGIVVGVGAALVIGALSPSLTATFASEQTALPRFAGAFGQGAVEAPSTSVALSAPVGVGLVGLAVALALLGGLAAGAVGSLRAARLRPADALRHVD
jgi:putative ABC transport system permease protein